jgi:hypothetical protein
MSFLTRTRVDLGKAQTVTSLNLELRDQAADMER